MRVTRSKSMTVLVMSTPPNCPRTLLGTSSARVRDDFKGSVKLSKTLMKKLATL